MRARPVLLPILLATGLVLGLGALASAQDVSCLSQSGTLIILTGAFPNGYTNTSLAANTKIDARGATFTYKRDVQPIVLGGGNNICFFGGSVLGIEDRNQTWQFYHGDTGFNLNFGGVLLDGPQGAKVENVRIDNLADGVRVEGGSQNFSYKNLWFTDMHDDCIDDHWAYSGTVDNVLCDGVYVGISTRVSGRRDGSNDLLTVKNSLFRLKPFPSPHSSESRDPGHGGMMKWDSAGASPKVSLHNNVFMAEQDTDAGDGLGISIRAVITSCSNNTILWTGPGPYPDQDTFNLKDPVTGEKCVSKFLAGQLAVDEWNRRKNEFIAIFNGGSPPSPPAAPENLRVGP